MGIGGRSWSTNRASHPIQGISARFGFRLAPTRLHQKSSCHPPNHTGRNLVSPPPFGDVPFPLVNQSHRAHKCQKGVATISVQTCTRPLCLEAAELSLRQSALVLQKSNAVFDAEPLLVDRLCFSRGWRISSRIFQHKDKPQRTLEAWLPIALVLEITR